MRSVQSALLSLHPNLTHSFSTKENGFSKAPYFENNLAYHVNDDPKIVKKNHLSFSQYLNYDLNKLAYMNQEHGTKVMRINKDTDLSKIPSCDALITKEKNIPLMVMVADCIPILIYEPNVKAIAVVHAGRAGTYKNILEKTISKMVNDFECEVDKLIIVLGPSIKGCCYEVGKEIKEEADKLKYNYAISHKDNSFYLDLISISIQQLINLGVNKERIEESKYCTSCHKDIFFSYRAENNKTGRFCGLLMLR